MLMVRPDRTRSDGAARQHRSGLDHRALAITFAAFAAFAGLVAIFSGGDDGIWGAWAACGYGVTAIAVWRWPDSLAAILPALIFGLAAPLAWLAIRAPGTPDVETVTRSASLLLHHGSPYLPRGQLVSWKDYNPYLPAMTAFGLPKAAGLPGLLGDPRPWLAVASAAVFAVAFSLGMPHRARRCASCRGDVLRYAVLAVASPICALSLAVGITDPPLLALMCLALALTARRSQPALAGLVIGVACAMKAIAWPALPVIAAMLASRDGTRTAARFCIASVVTAAALVVAMAPALLTRRSGFLENTVLFPLGATPQHTPAASPLPGHLLAVTGPAGHAAAICLVVVAALAVAASLVVRPPADTRAATWRLAIGLALLFALAPDARFGYFAYPAALVGWLAITGRAQAAAAGTAAPEAATAPAAATVATAAESTAESMATEITATGGTVAEASAAEATTAGTATVPTTAQGARGGTAHGVTPKPVLNLLLPALGLAARVRLRWRRRWRSRPAAGSASGRG
jgi:Glycosyltransferase family 87